jgi:hypothetical protein
LLLAAAAELAVLLPVVLPVVLPALLSAPLKLDDDVPLTWLSSELRLIADTDIINSSFHMTIHCRAATNCRQTLATETPSLSIASHLAARFAHRFAYPY